MPRPVRSFTLGVLLTVLVPSSPAHAAGVVRLIDWAGTATLVPNAGPGLEYFELPAEVEWTRDVSGRFSVRVVSPDGRFEDQAVLDHEGPGARRLTAFVRAPAVRNIRPAAVAVRMSVIDAATGAEVSNALVAGIGQFPRPRPEGTEIDPGPFGWGIPLDGPPGAARPLRRPGPDDWRFVRIPSASGRPGFFIATTEATNAQVALRLPGYDPQSGRSDDLSLEGPKQPAIGLTPKKAQDYLAALRHADSSGLTYRLPTVEEWLLAARAGRSSAFWWGDQPTYPSGANFLGPEPALATDTTAPSLPPPGSPRFHANPWRLYHGFGNVAEWAVLPSGGFVRMGGHFRSEPSSPMPEVAVQKADTTGPDPYVGVRPVFVLDAASGAELLRKELRSVDGRASLQVSFDPDRATATLSGDLPSSTLRRRVDDLLAPLWFLAAVEDRIATPTFPSGRLAQLGAIAGPVRRITPLGRWIYEVPVEVRWADPLPVAGSEWWVNLYLPGGGYDSHRLVEGQPDRSRKITVLVDRGRMLAAGLAVDSPFSVALSLGSRAANPGDEHVASNVVAVRWSLRP